MTILGRPERKAANIQQSDPESHPHHDAPSPGTPSIEPAASRPNRALEVFLAALRLGLTSFGGPIAHLGYFRAEYVERRRWLDDAQYADLVGLCQFLPGPTSSELGIAIGITRGGLGGGLAAWLGFTLPSAVALTLFAAVVRHGNILGAGWLHGLQLVAVAVVAQALWSMARTLTPDWPRAALAVLAAIAMLAAPSPATPVLAIAAAGCIGWRFLPTAEEQPAIQAPSRVSRTLALGAWILFLALLIGLPLLRRLAPGQPLALLDSFYRAGALVFGGGHVVLPLLQAAVVPPGWVSAGQFVAGYGAAQAVPGPLFTFAAYLGAVEGPQPNGVVGASIALCAIFLPALLLVLGCLPIWAALRARPGARSVLRGVNAAVVGLLLAALYTPVWTSAVRTIVDVVVVFVALALLVRRVPPWLVVLLTATAGAAIEYF
jgi:chromate transporter